MYFFYFDLCLPFRCGDIKKHSGSERFFFFLGGGGCYGIGGPLESIIFRESYQQLCMVYRVVVREVTTTGL